jgi:nucleotide-binding universal stress UspA family protein
VSTSIGPAASHSKPPRIVAGVDGSPESIAALRWAAQQAGLTGGTVDAIIAWQLPVEMSGYGYAPLTVAECSEFVADAAKTVNEAIAEVTGPGGSPQVRGLVIEGHPAQVLLDASADADLLVVGSRGQGLFADALLGSVSEHCFRHAQCPVVVMRGEPVAVGAA